MKVFQGFDIWDFYDKRNHWVVLTTNGVVDKENNLVMGAGIAKQAKERFPELPYILGTEVRLTGNHVYSVPKYRVISFPTKEHWKDKSSLDLIEQSARELKEMLVDGTHAFSFSFVEKKERIVCPKPGCGLGGLVWEDVLGVIKPYFDSIGENKIAIVDNASLKTKRRKEKVR